MVNNSYEFDPKMYNTVFNNIKKYREINGFSIEELSEYTKIDKKILEKMENKAKNVTISIYDLYKISVILEVSIEKFFDI